MVVAFFVGLLSAFVLIIAGIVVYWYIRPNASSVSPWLIQKTWDVGGEGRHQAFTDMVHWRGDFYLAYRVARNHMDLRSKLVVMRSPDARAWLTVAELREEGEDLRDPKLVVIRDRLFLYALKNRSTIVKSYTTVCTSSQDGETWDPWQPVEPEGWVFWRPVSNDNKTWYVVATWRTYTSSNLLRSSDGINWHNVSVVYTGDLHGEVSLAFLSDRELVCAARVAGETAIHVLGGSTDTTLIGISKPPFTQWSFYRSDVARLDGSVLFRYRGQAYAAARFEPEARHMLLKRGNAICRKRTALYLIDEDALIYLSDLPSGGDTAYPGVVVYGDDLYVSYYTNDIQRDYPWCIGMIKPTKVRIARIRLSSLPENRMAALALTRRSTDVIRLPPRLGTATEPFRPTGPMVQRLPARAHHPLRRQVDARAGHCLVPPSSVGGP